MNDMVHGRHPTKHAKIHYPHTIVRHKDFNITTQEQVKLYRPVLKKRRVLHGSDRTIPHGYVKEVQI